MCECQDMSMDVKTPRNVYLSAFYKRSFAYHTVKNRMPIILTQLIDNLVRSKEDIIKSHEVQTEEDVKQVIGELSKFKYEIQTNKPLLYLTTNEPDVSIYNDYIKKQASEEGHTTHFNTVWLLTECYMYRRIKEIFSLTDTLKDFDYFQNSKQESFHKALDLMTNLATYLLKLEHINTQEEGKKAFLSLLKLNLWGNKCDLSISLGRVSGPQMLLETDWLESHVVADDSQKIWQVVSDLNDTSEIIDIVLDNSGYELFTDCCLADFLIDKNFTKKVRMYVKTIPWFISDVMVYDFHWTFKQLQESKSESLKTLGNRWQNYLETEQWEIIADSFWTLPYEFKFMKDISPELYKKLSEAKLIIFKGDLNYRKLFGEINWDPVTSVEEALQNFHPSKLCTLRTIKADIVVGLKKGVAESIAKVDAKWMENGDYGLIQFCDKVVKI